MSRRTRVTTKCTTPPSDDPEYLQALDESNVEWVEEWKKTAKPKMETKQ